MVQKAKRIRKKRIKKSSREEFIAVMRKGSIDWILDRCQTEPNSGCWLPNLAFFKGAYPRFFIENSLIQASRISWILFNKKQIPEKMYALHKCDNIYCCNPQHIFIGSIKDNGIDASRKKRLYVPLPAEYQAGSFVVKDYISDEGIPVYNRKTKKYEISKVEPDWIRERFKDYHSKKDQPKKLHSKQY